MFRGYMVPVEILNCAKKMGRRQGLAAVFKPLWLCVWLLSFLAVLFVCAFEVLDSGDSLGPAGLNPSAISLHTSLIRKKNSNLDPDVAFARAGAADGDISSPSTAEHALSSKHVSEANATEGKAGEQDLKRTGRFLSDNEIGDSFGKSTGYWLKHIFHIYTYIHFPVYLHNSNERKQKSPPKSDRLFCRFPSAFPPREMRA